MSDFEECFKPLYNYQIFSKKKEELKKLEDFLKNGKTDSEKFQTYLDALIPDDCGNGLCIYNILLLK